MNGFPEECFLESAELKDSWLLTAELKDSWLVTSPEGSSFRALNK